MERGHDGPWWICEDRGTGEMWVSGQNAYTGSMPCGALFEYDSEWEAEIALQKMQGKS